MLLLRRFIPISHQTVHQTTALCNPVLATPSRPLSCSTPTAGSKMGDKAPSPSAAKPAHAQHPDFKTIEASRPPWDATATPRFTQTVAPGWHFGDGANGSAPTGAGEPQHRHIAIDPDEPGRPAGYNYKLLIGAVVPRPIAFVSTRGKGDETNLAPFSYFQMMAHDPPLFVVGFASPLERAKDTLRNLLDTKECVINIISEGFVEAANATSVNVPYGASEWAVSGLTPVYDCRDVKCARVQEAVFSIEGKLESVREFESRTTPGKKTSTMVVIEGTNFWVREDAINEKNMVDFGVLRPISRLGGITYGRTTEMIELPRPDFQKDIGGQEAYQKLKEAASDATKTTTKI